MYLYVDLVVVASKSLQLTQSYLPISHALGLLKYSSFSSFRPSQKIGHEFYIHETCFHCDQVHKLRPYYRILGRYLPDCLRRVEMGFRADETLDLLDLWVPVFIGGDDGDYDCFAVQFDPQCGSHLARVL